MVEQSQRIAAGQQVAIAFEIALPSGQVLDRADEAEPLVLELGDGQLHPNLEALITGLEVGTEAKFSVPPEDGFGYPDPNNVYDIDKVEFAGDMDLKPGLVIGFTTPTGDEIPGTVVAVDDEQQQVKVDFNHPLAGENFVFTVKVLAVKGH
ncbi:peptidylprolyl isomerase [Thiomicrospira sp. ALE5]|uniref:FKBP-type peptidyl-prolyl cis-trans isomerase n=1 Tax=Thiomicrospira sp. ALE5 TaxID=748650 RepID=UPI0008E41150|nr:FKBP-type peptidyl-prolyl cis-trans isomerase [Thiomicrospira sp. ALE5]SFR52034.1 FKBP-type peptidyl-prolyl cis-trans isomerase SlpA [Thiomicrospira sp. ALE5]